MSGAYGFQSKLCFAAFATPAVIDGTAKLLEYQSEGLRLSNELIDANGLKGTRSRYGNRVRAGRNRVAGPVTLQPTAVDLANSLPYLYGAAAAGTNFPLGETLTPFSVCVDRVLKVFTYAGCAISRGAFSVRAGGPLELALDVVGQTETVANAGTFPAITPDATTRPFVLSDLVITVGGTAYKVDNFTLAVDNQVDADRFFNSQTMLSPQATDRVVTFSFDTPYGDSGSLYATITAGTTFAAVATFTDGGTSLTLSLPSLFSQAQSPVAGGRQEILLPVSGRAYRDAVNPEITTTLDSTP